MSRLKEVLNNLKSPEHSSIDFDKKLIDKKIIDDSSNSGFRVEVKSMKRPSTSNVNKAQKIDLQNPQNFLELDKSFIETEFKNVHDTFQYAQEMKTKSKT